MVCSDPGWCYCCCWRGDALPHPDHCCFCFSSFSAASGSRGMELSQSWKPNHLGFCFDFFSPNSFLSQYFGGSAQHRGRRWLKLWGAARHCRSSAGSRGLSCASQWSKPGLRRSVYYQESSSERSAKKIKFNLFLTSHFQNCLTTGCSLRRRR